VERRCLVTPEKHWWWSIERGQAEYGFGDFLDQRLGPYDTQEEAEHAMDRVRRRNEEWDNDPIYGENS
jgi:hypothetical protein